VQCDLSRVSIHYAAKGKGQPFVFLHGSPSDHNRAMVQIEPAFRGRHGWRRIYPDLPGHGRTPGSARIRSMDDFLDVLLEFVDQVSNGGPFSIGGISFGAYLALGIARKRSRRVKGLLLSAPEINHSPLEDRRDEAFKTPSIQTPAELIPQLPDYVEDTAWLQSMPFRDMKMPLYRGHGTFRAPALFLIGRQDAPFRSQKYWKMLPDFPHATFAVLDGAGHTIWNDRNDLACALVRDWLDRVSGDVHEPVRSRL
jgi:pimeloyl-ACP methyl ester carboxylesterase